MRLSLLVVAVVIIGMGVLPAYVLARDGALAFTLSGAITLSAAGIGGLISVAVSSPLLVGVIPVVLAVNATAVWWMVRQRAAGRRSPGDVGGRGFDAAFVIVGLFVPALVSLAHRSAPPFGWDARSIFWFHASWFEHGGGLVRSSIANPVMYFSHSDYPPGPPALIGSFWKFSGGEDLALARDVGFVLTALAIAGLVWLVVGRRRTTVSMLVGVLFVAGTPLLAEGLSAFGYYDMVTAALVVSAVVAYRELPHPTGPVVGAAMLMAASLTKGEGLYLGFFAVLVLVACARSHRRVTAIASGVAFVPVLAWLGLVRTIDSGVRDVPPSGLIRLATYRWPERHRFKVSVPEVFGEVQPYLLLALVVVVAAAAALALERSLSAIAMPAFMVGLGLVFVLLLAAIYAAGPYELSWWFSTSLARVSTAPKLLFVGAAAKVVLMAAERDRVVRFPNGA